MDIRPPPSLADCQHLLQAVQAAPQEAYWPSLLCAALGLCLADHPKAVKSLRKHKYDACDYGAAIYDYLRDNGHSDSDIVKVAVEAMQLVADRIAAVQEGLEDGADPFAGRATLTTQSARSNANGACSQGNSVASHESNSDSPGPGTPPAPTERGVPSGPPKHGASRPAG